VISREEIRLYKFRRDLGEAERVEGTVAGDIVVTTKAGTRTYRPPKGGWPREILDMRPRNTRTICRDEVRNESGDRIVAASVVPTVFHSWSRCVNLDLEWLERNPACLLDNPGPANDLKRLIMAMGRDRSAQFDAGDIQEVIRLAMGADLDEAPVNWPEDAEPVTRRDVLVTAVMDGHRLIPTSFPGRGRVTLPLLEVPKLALSSWAYAGPQELYPQDCKTWIVPFAAILADLYNGYWVPDRKAPRLTADQARASLRELLDLALPIPGLVAEIIRFMADPDPDTSEECRKMAEIFASLHGADFTTWLQRESVRRAIFSQDVPEPEPLL
jgi:hypothetical protein